MLSLIVMSSSSVSLFFGLCRFLIGFTTDVQSRSVFLDAVRVASVVLTFNLSLVARFGRLHLSALPDLCLKPVCICF